VNEYIRTSTKYVRISNELYHEFETAAKKDKECEFVYLDNNNEVSIKTKILQFTNINQEEYMAVKDGINIRLDKIVSFNGENTKILNHY